MPQLCIHRLAFGRKGAQTSPAPLRTQVGRIFVPRAPELPGKAEESAE